MQRGNRTLKALYPATSNEHLNGVCQKLAAAFDLPAFTLSHQSEHLETATASSAEITIAVTRFTGSIDAEQASRMGPPDFWNLAWRAAVGLEFNYQVAITHGPLTRNQQRSVARKLRSVFQRIRMHGDPAAA